MLLFDDAAEEADRRNLQMANMGWEVGVDFDEWTTEDVLTEWEDGYVVRYSRYGVSSY